MSPAEEGAYIRLLAIAWMQPDCGLPDDDTQLAALSRLGDDWNKGGISVVKGCFKKYNGRLYNERLLQERKKQDDWKNKSSEGGKLGAKARWRNKLDPVKGGHQMVITKSSPKHDSSSSSSSSIPPPSPPKGVPSPALPADIADELLEYPQLSEQFVLMVKAIVKHHPGARFPQRNTKQYREQRNAVARLIRIDGCLEEDLIPCLHWIFNSDHPQALFWRKQVSSFTGLRSHKGGKTMSKWAQIYELWKREVSDDDND